jgi:hypothetical protein
MLLVRRRLLLLLLLLLRWRRLWLLLGLGLRSGLRSGRVRLGRGRWCGKEQHKLAASVGPGRSCVLQLKRSAYTR